MINNFDVRFVAHEACPRCNSRDNVAVYSDGHKYCFGCLWYNPPTLKHQILNSVSEVIPDFVGVDISDYSRRIPERPLRWLRDYALTDKEIYDNYILWNDAGHSLCYPVIVNKVIVRTNERYFGYDPHHPKYITRGKRRDIPIIRNPTNGIGIVFVEDWVSAIKVARLASAVPMFGSGMALGALKSTATGFKKAGMWSDPDKAAESLRIASRASSVDLPFTAIISEADPKELPMKQIRSLLRGGGLLPPA
jgi:hypothetical protein